RRERLERCHRLRPRLRHSPVLIPAYPENLMAANFRTASIRDIKQLFAASPVPDASLRHGFFRASFVGPFWYRIGGFPSVHCSGLPYWQGKKFLTPDSATNILKQGNGMVQALSMTVVAGASLIDGKPGV